MNYETLAKKILLIHYWNTDEKEKDKKKNTRKALAKFFALHANAEKVRCVSRFEFITSFLLLLNVLQSSAIFFPLLKFNYISYRLFLWAETFHLSGVST